MNGPQVMFFDANVLMHAIFSGSDRKGIYFASYNLLLEMLRNGGVKSIIYVLQDRFTKPSFAPRALENITGTKVRPHHENAKRDEW